ncbi:AMP-binding protein [Endozoicomonas numazuensis]|uniref:AMP-dependent synthetase/ligase domain-containing protein n=1 Tax=Endozoicomonas numazuensis TaxID=1137799 RepID=A0A081NJ85_9GAMM|nr:AMP-binding protein [Endozoicomonas numazuensis]KEQ18508.1 hypothetical protein GZ78_13580 [Endozoicomonas numazuensis]
MNTVIDALKKHANQISNKPALESGSNTLSWEKLWFEVQGFAKTLQNHKIRKLAIDADNGFGWVIADLACLESQIISVPIPPFFTASQKEHLLKTAGVDAILSSSISGNPIAECHDLSLFKHRVKVNSLPFQSCQKITFTSGSTGSPKGVCLSAEHQLNTAQAINSAIGSVEGDKHLCLLPLSTLLENIAGLYVPILRGMSIAVPSTSDVGLKGSSSLDTSKLVQSLSRFQPASLILTPQLLLALVAATQQGWTAPSSLKFIAVGGGRVSQGLLEKAHKMGLPVFEGYGLSECCSVVSLNTPRALKAGSTGRPLSHCQVEINNDEVVVKGSCFLGYLGQPENLNEAVFTGDTGYIDASGFLHITGRRKNLLISSFGRNISPEWPESELMQTGLFSHCLVAGDSRPFCTALVRLLPGVTDEQVISALSIANRQLPDYAQIKGWTLMAEPQADQWTANGRPRRDKILQANQRDLDKLYQQLQEPAA